MPSDLPPPPPPRPFGTDQIMEAFGTLVSNVQVALGKVRGVTCLPLPPDPGLYTDGGDENQARILSKQRSYLTGRGGGEKDHGSPDIFGEKIPQHGRPVIAGCYRGFDLPTCTMSPK